MTIEELADVIGQRLVIDYRCNWELSARWYAHFPSGEIKEGNILRGMFGNGSTPLEALDNFKKEIAGKLMVFNAMRQDRKEVRIPKELI